MAWDRTEIHFWEPDLRGIDVGSRRGVAWRRGWGREGVGGHRR